MDVKTLCLAILSRGDASGYEIRKELSQGVFSTFYDAGYGSIYPALQRLTEEKLVMCREVEQSKRPDKKIYALTPHGSFALLDALRRRPDADKFRSSFLLTLLFSSLLLPRDLDALIDNRLNDLRGEIEQSQSAAQRSEDPADRFAWNYNLAIARAAFDYLEGQRHELLRLALVGERDQPPPNRAAAAR